MSQAHNGHRRRRISGAAIATGLGGSLVLSLSLGASFSAYTATITNTTNTAASNSLAIKEVGKTNATGTCLSYDTTATCSTINKYGTTATPLSPGGSQTQVVTFSNPGTIAVGTSTLAPGACVATSNGVTGSTTPSATPTDPSNLCSVMNIAVYKGDTTTTAIYNGSAAAFTATINIGTLAVNASQDYTFVVSLPANASTAIQGQKISQPLTWTFNQ